MSTCSTVEEALAFIREHGVVLVSAKGPAPRLVEAIIGGPIKGSWWAHPESRQIYNILEAVTKSEQVLVCRLVNGKITLVHCRLWPALVRLATRFAPGQLAQVQDEHTPSGRHVSRETPFPLWVPANVLEKAALISEHDALAQFGRWMSSPPPAPPKSGPKNL